MYKRSYVTVFFIVLLHTIANASGEPTIPFVDGRWSGGIETGPSGLIGSEESDLGFPLRPESAIQTDAHWYFLHGIFG